jgi:hypothetical protein
VTAIGRYILVVAVSLVLVGVLLAGLNRIGFRLPSFIAGTLASQPSPPRSVTILTVARAVLAGLDGATYAVAGVFLSVIGLAVITGTPQRLGQPDNLVRPIFENSWFGVGCLAAGVICLLLIGFRIWQVHQALRIGQAQVAEITEAQTGRARLTGTPWGDLIWGNAARGNYQVQGATEAGHHYMQQRWALSLRTGDRIWILRLDGRDVLYAPIQASTN